MRRTAPMKAEQVCMGGAQLSVTATGRQSSMMSRKTANKLSQVRPKTRRIQSTDFHRRIRYGVHISLSPLLLFIYRPPHGGKPRPLMDGIYAIGSATLSGRTSIDEQCKYAYITRDEVFWLQWQSPIIGNFQALHPGPGLAYPWKRCCR